MILIVMITTSIGTYYILSYITMEDQYESDSIIVKETFTYNILEDTSSIYNHDLHKFTNNYYTINYSTNDLNDLDTYKNYIDEANDKINNIKELKQDNLEGWYIEYKSILDEYSKFIDKPETIYDYFTEEEINILHRIVEAECEGLEFQKKVNVANVIFNRIEDNRFPNNVKDVIFQKNPIQFSPIKDGRYYKVELQEDTILAIEYAFMFPDTTNGSIYFEATYSNELSGKSMCDGSHKFYR